MSRELDAVKHLRPDVPTVSAEALEAGRRRLQTAIATEADAVTRPRGRRRAQWLRSRVPSLGTLGVVSAALLTVVVAVGAIALLGHGHHPTTGAAGANPGAMRGEIVGRHGLVLAGSAPSREVQILVASLPRAATPRAAELGRLARVLDLPTRPAGCRILHPAARVSPLQCDVDDARAAGQARATVATNVPARIAQSLTAQRARLPGVAVHRTTRRTYPNANIAAQALGVFSATVGSSGLEAEYNGQLSAGDSLRTSLDAQLQRTGEQALAHAITANRATSGAFVAMDPQTGALDALGSSPSYGPRSLAGANAPAAYRKLSHAGSSPLLDRATQAVAPVGSTITPITALAALQGGVWSRAGIYDDTGQFCQGSGATEQCRHNSGHAAYGALSLTSALRVSSNDFFYNLGAKTNADAATSPTGGALDRWARSLGIGQATGVDLPGAANGTLPTPRWRARRNRLERECDRATGPYTGRRTHPPGGCGIADGTDRPWSIGDNESLAVGQGDLQVSPLQLATAYAAIANGGTVVRPHLGAAIVSPTGTVLHRIDPAGRRLHLDPANLRAVQDGLRDASAKPGGTTQDVFGDFPDPVHGQAGTARYISVTGTLSDSAWYAGYVPASATHRPLVVVVWVQRGGFGAVAAAPVARQLFSQWLLGHPGPWRPGTSAVQ